MNLSRNELRRLHECLTCPFFERCEIEVANPEDYPDGRCKTKDMFNEKLVNETCKMYETAAIKMLEDWLNN
ncbi:hypothetical protein DW106_03250 [Ruminococcus sp. AM09-18-1]|jgi:hypothetical protein|nr:hypothetical protein DW106_03250 [Ruminococcus sp. AM09-18-1]